MFGAYTIKKLLPRLIIAAIAIQLSWWLSLEAIRLTNDVARGIQGLIYAPFGGSGAMTMSKIIASNPSVNQASFNGTAIFGGLAAGTAFLVAGPSSLVGILALAVSAALGILIALFTLILRQAVIIGLVVTGPLAIAAWILPGTQKLWKIWWESFSKLLLMYPLILIIIAGGRVFAYIAANTTGINQFAQFAMIVLGVFGPLFLIPATLKVSGAAFGALTGAINNKGKGAFDRLRNVRSNESKKNWANTKAGQRFRGSNAATARLNRIGRGVAAGPGNGFGLGARGRVFDDEASAVGAEAMMKTERWQGAKYKDDVMRALTYQNENQARAALRAREEAAAAREGRAVDYAGVEANLISAKRIGYGRTSQIAAAQQLSMNKTGYENAADAMETVQRVAGNNNVLEGSLRENIKFTSKQVGRNDMGALRSMRAGETRQQWNDSMTSEGFDGVDTFSLGREHATSYMNMATAHAQQYYDAYQDYQADPTNQAARDLVIESRTKLEETMKNASSATGKNARVATRLSKLINDVDADFRNSMPTEALDVLGVDIEPRPGQGITQGAVGGGGAARAPESRDRDIYNRDRAGGDGT